MTSLPDLIPVALIGAGATAVMDVWLSILRRAGVPTMNFAFIGRWAGHLFSGTLAHAAIAQAEPIRHELPLGWLVHYASGIAFAALLVAIQGPTWVARPTLLPAVATGVATVLAPWALMQPAMGFGFAASKTPTPLRNALRSLANHTVFGLGLYLSAVVLTLVVTITLKPAATTFILEPSLLETAVIPQKYAPILFGLILSGLMSLLVSGLSTFGAMGPVPGFASRWARAWLLAWPIAFPVVLLAAPLARRVVARMTAER